MSCCKGWMRREAIRGWSGQGVAVSSGARGQGGDCGGCAAAAIPGIIHTREGGVSVRHPHFSISPFIFGERSKTSFLAPTRVIIYLKT